MSSEIGDDAWNELAPVQPTEPPCYHISKGVDGETVVTTTYEPPELSEEFIQDAMRLAAEFEMAALEAHLRGKEQLTHADGFVGSFRKGEKDDES